MSAGRGPSMVSRVTSGRRILFSAAGGHGHLQPLLPLAEQALRAGHEVLVTAAASLAGQATARVLAFAASGPDLRPIAAPLAVHAVEDERRAVARYFVARLGAARARDVLDVCRSWRPDVVVRDEVDFGAAVAAEAAGLPHVQVVVIGAGGFILPELVDDPLNVLLAEFGVEPLGAGVLQRHLTLTPFPAFFRDPAHPLTGTTLRYHVPPPPKVHRTAAGKTVFVTLGTIFNTESGDLLRTAALGAAGCHDVKVVVVATGEHVDPAALGPLPSHVTAHRFVDQDAVLAASDAVISHGGSGTVLGALKQALPSVTLPMGADQQLNSDRLRALGLGVSMAADAATAQEIRDALHGVLTDTPMAQRLDGLREELLDAVGPGQAVAAAAALAR